ncbi:ACT domain-containing protein [Ammonicoccus fulvus]|uniref:ACT domain-containing protein n=1 Tax=Ammonicoccus fulvus TaxID=3138240 RepID=A0ABZ3FIW8_9ACTN
MATYVITLIGDDRVGLVQSLADGVARTGGNWERSSLAELAGKFAGIVMVTVPDDRAEELADNLRHLDGMLDVRIQRASEETTAAEDSATIRLELVGNDRPGIVNEISTALRSHGITIDKLESHVSDAPMYGGQLFNCNAVLRGPESALSGARADLERIATELMVDLNLVADAA